METNELVLNLTQSQYDAVTHPLDSDTNLVLLAGPGAGKTRTLVSKIAYCLSEGIAPQEILVLSLTNRAVSVLKEQLTHLVREELASLVKIHTFHSFAISIVSEYSKDWRLLEDIDWRALIDITSDPNQKDRFDRRTKKFKRKDLEQILNLADTGYSLEEIHDQLTSATSTSDVENVLNWLHHSKVVTYSLLLKTATRQILKSPDIVNDIKVVIVDEFQDMYDELLSFVKLIASSKHLVIAGDPNQSIFGFLGSNPDLMFTFARKFPTKHTSMITFQECFRSTPEIILLSDELIQSKIPRIHVKDSGPMPIYRLFDSEFEEFEFIVEEVNKLLTTSNGLVKPSDILIIGRTNKKIDSVKNHLELNDIKTIKLSSTQSWIDSYIYYFLIYLQILSNPGGSDHAILSALILLEGVGNITLRKVMKEIADRNSVSSLMDQISLWDFLQNNESLRHKKMFSPFVSTIDESLEQFSKVKENPDELIKFLLKLADKLGLRRKIIKSFKTPLGTQKYQEYLREFYDSLCLSYHLKPQETPLVEYFLHHYAESPPPKDETLVNVSTIHAAKGLEFPICFVLANEYSFAFQSPKFALDERRISYVAITRASALLFYNENRTIPDNRAFFDPSKVPQYFSLKSPTYNTDFWNQYSRVLGKPRNYHTVNHRFISTSHKLLRCLTRL